MGCGGKRQQKLVQITTTSRVRKQSAATTDAIKKLPSAPPPATSRPELVIGTFHCANCGLTLLNRPETYTHRCKRTREKICDQCEHSVEAIVDGEAKRICSEQKRLHPDRDAVIIVGVTMPNAYCPLGKWTKR